MNTTYGTNAPAAPPANADEKHERLAAAVVDSKTTAPVDMQYDLLAKPDTNDNVASRLLAVLDKLVT